MTRKYTPPTVEPDDMHGQKFSHPSYAVVQISRVSGAAELFDSSISHQHYITMRICRATKHGDGSHDFIFAGERLIEVAMSETQFARVITSMNMGSGAPCTLQYLDGKMVDQPEREDLLNTHKEMVQDKLTGVLEAQITIGKQVAEWRKQKHRPTLKELDTLAQELHGMAAHFEHNMGYYASCFEGHMEEVVDEAKAEIETHMLATAGRLGVEREELPAIEMSAAPCECDLCNCFGQGNCELHEADCKHCNSGKDPKDCPWLADI